MFEFDDEIFDESSDPWTFLLGTPALTLVEATYLGDDVWVLSQVETKATYKENVRSAITDSLIRE
jgi:hypothetical protein